VTCGLWLAPSELAEMRLSFLAKLIVGETREPIQGHEDALRKVWRHRFKGHLAPEVVELAVKDELKRRRDKRA